MDPERRPKIEIQIQGRPVSFSLSCSPAMSRDIAVSHSEVRSVCDTLVQNVLADRKVRLFDANRLNAPRTIPLADIVAGLQAKDLEASATALQATASLRPPIRLGTVESQGKSRRCVAFAVVEGLKHLGDLKLTDARCEKLRNYLTSECGTGLEDGTTSLKKVQTFLNDERAKDFLSNTYRIEPVSTMVELVYPLRTGTGVALLAANAHQKVATNITPSGVNVLDSWNQNKSFGDGRQHLSLDKFFSTYFDKTPFWSMIDSKETSQIERCLAYHQSSPFEWCGAGKLTFLSGAVLLSKL